MDEFDIFLARAYGSVDHSEPPTPTSPDPSTPHRHHHHRRRSGTRRSSTMRTHSGEELPGSPRLDDPSLEPSPGERRRESSSNPRLEGPTRPALKLSGGERRRISSQVTVAIEPPSPTDESGGHRRTLSWRTRQPEVVDEEEGVAGKEDPSRLQRTRTMPARRSPSPARNHKGTSNGRSSLSRCRTPTPDDDDLQQVYEIVPEAGEEQVYLENLDENRNHQSSSTSPSSLHVDSTSLFADPSSIYQDPSSVYAEHGSLYPQDGGCTSPVLGECKIYRVRSFTTKKGGSIVNRGDSIKVCSGGVGGRRCSSIMLDVVSANEASRRRSTSSTEGGLLTSPIPNLRRRSTSGLIMNLNGGGIFEGNQGAITPSTAPAYVGDNIRRLSASPVFRRASDQGQNIPLTCLTVSPDGNLCLPGEFNQFLNGELQIDTPVDGLEQVDDRVFLIGDENGYEGGMDGEELGEDESSVLRVAVLGSQGVGKTTLTRQLLTSEYLANKETPDIDDAYGDQIVSVQIDDEESMIQFFDLPDVQEPSDCGEVDGYAVVYSVTDRTSFLRAQDLLQELRRSNPSRVSGAVLLIANKQDLVRNRTVSETEGRRLANKRQCKLIEVSALLDHKVDELLVAMIREIRAESRDRAVTSCSTGVAMGDKNEPVKGCIQKAAFGIFKKLFK